MLWIGIHINGLWPTFCSLDNSKNLVYWKSPKYNIHSVQCRQLEILVIVEKVLLIVNY